MNGFKFDFSNKFWGGARAPSPGPFPRFCSGVALSSGFTLNSWAFRTIDLGFAQILGRFAASIRASPSTLFIYFIYLLILHHATINTSILQYCICNL